MWKAVKSRMASKSLKGVAYKNWPSPALCLAGLLTYLVAILSGTLLFEHGPGFLAELDKSGLGIATIVVGAIYGFFGLIFLVSGAFAKRFGEILYQRHLD